MLFKLLSFFFLAPTLFAYELSILAMFKNEGRYLREWVDYHRLVGVEHFWLYNDHSTDNWQDVLHEDIETGVVEIIDWTAGTGFTQQAAIYRDGIQKSLGLTKWLAIIDLDEFVLPMKEKTITDCLNKHYSDANAIYVNWRNFGTGKVTVPEGDPILFHLIACSMPNHSNNSVGKCILKPEVVLIETLEYPHHFDLKDGVPYYGGNANLLPVKDGRFCFDQKHQDKFLRINHYVLRDEYFFWNYRWKRTEDLVLLQEHYESFSRLKDFSIHRFVREMHPEKFTKQ
jgi:hypothetical protein